MNRHDNRELWEYVLTQVELSISPANFNTWFRDSSIVKVEEGIVYIGVPSQFFKDWFLKKFHTLLLKIIRGVSHEYRNIEYQIVKSDRQKVQKESRRQPQPTVEMPLDEFYINKSDGLNPRYTFDSFVVGSFNELAHTAAQAALKRPGILYNPLFIYGETGRGKTHLIQAIGNQIKDTYPDKFVLYVSTEKFTNQFVNAIRNNSIEAFTNFYLQVDVLIIDDVQFLSGKEKTQETFFNIFNHLHQSGKQIILSSDRAPRDLAGMEDRLLSRFKWGLTADLQQPDFETRIAIIQKKLQEDGIQIDFDVLEYLAHSIQTNVRELEGVIISLMAQASLTRKGIKCRKYTRCSDESL